jgi:hypothetical protein
MSQGAHPALVKSAADVEERGRIEDDKRWTAS